MRTLFFILFLINIVFLLWQFHLGHLNMLWQSKAESAVSVASAKQILLVNEAEQLSAKQVAALPQIALPAPPPLKTHEEIKDLPVTVIELAAETTTPPPSPATSQCQEVGPFNDEAALQVWLNSQKLTGTPFKTFYKGGSQPSSFLVYYPSRTPEQSHQAKQLLAANGIKDAWIIPGGEFQGAVSLGVFRMKNGAERLQAQMAQKGLEVQVRPRQSGKPALYIQLNSEKTLNKPAGGLAVKCVEKL